MSRQRTPAKSTKKIAPPYPGSDSSLSEKQEVPDPNITKRTKRRLGELSDDSYTTMNELRSILSQLRTEQDSKLDSIKMVMNAIQEQNQEIKKSVELMSDKYDDVIETMKKLQQENNQYKNRIETLEAKIEQYELSNRATSVEFRNVPLEDAENKQGLIEVVKKICTPVNAPVQDSEIRDVFRLKLKNKTTSPIIVNFNSTVKKENLIKASKSFNKSKESNQRLSTHTINIKGPVKQIYVAEFLTPKARRLHYLAREFVKTNKYESCWTSYGKVYLRRNPSEPRKQIANEMDLERLKKSD